jgi:hypothetical protein
MTTTTTEPITQTTIDRALRDRLAALLPLLSLATSEFYDDWFGERFTDDGWSTLSAAETVAWDGATALHDVMEKGRPELDESLLRDVQRFLAVVARALKGMEVNGPESLDGPVPVEYLLELGRGLQERARPERDLKNGGGAPPISVEPHVAKTTETPTDEPPKPSLIVDAEMAEHARNIMSRLPGSDEVDELYGRIVELAGRIDDVAKEAPDA